MTNKGEIRDFFKLPADIQKKLRSEVIINPAPITEGILCDICSGSGKCTECNGEGKTEHDCDCIYCDYLETCDECSGNGKCIGCHGVGIIRKESQSS